MIKSRTAQLIFQTIYCTYFASAVCRSVEEKAMVIGYTRMLRRAVRRPNDADSPAKIARCKEMLAILLDKVDTLVF